MLTNPLWRCSVSRFRESLGEWVYGIYGTDGPMHLAIFFDAAAVAGDAGLLAEARAPAEDACGQRCLPGALRRRGRPVRRAAELVVALTARSDEQPLDLKKLGTFPIVHGAGCWRWRKACERARRPRRALVERGTVDAELGRDLIEALHYLMGLKLRHQLRQREHGKRPATWCGLT